MTKHTLIAATTLAAMTLLPVTGLAETADTVVERSAPAGEHSSVANEVPRLAYVHSAFGSSRGTVGAGGFGIARDSFSGAERAWFGGGVRVWGSPVDRLTLLADAERRNNGEFAPSASAQLRFLGSRSQHYALGILGRYLAEGFAELEGEIEAGLLGSYARRGLHLDANLLVGAGFEESEADAEALARLGYDVFSVLRLGAEVRGRCRVAGDQKLPGDRDCDVFGGPQLLAYAGNFWAAGTLGPSTVGIASEIGWSAAVTAGGVMF